MTAAAHTETPQSLELRVSAGPQRGAQAPLTLGAPCVLAAGPHGHDDPNAHIVLLDEQGAVTRVRVVADLPEGSLEVLEGKVKLGQAEYTVGQRAAWPAHARMTLGSAVVAFGRAGEATWPGTEDEWVAEDETATSGAMDADAQAAFDRALAAGDRASGGKAAGKSSGADKKSGKAKVGAFRRAEVWLATTGVTVLLACGAAVTYLHFVGQAPSTTASTGGPADPVTRLNAALRASEFGGVLQAVNRGNGQVVLRGRLSTIEQRDKLDQWLATAPMTPVIEVTTDEAVAREVMEVFRINGIAADAKVVAPGRITAEVAELDTAAVSRATEAVRRDVRGLENLEVSNTAKPAAPPEPVVPADPGKRIASLVPGATPYVVTADGSRYFVGAILPSGHRIVKIGANSVALERNGQKTNLNF